MRLMADAKSGNIDAILTWKIDRFSRSLRHLLNTLDELQNIGVAFVSLKENLDLTTSVGKLMSHVIGAFAQFEKDLIRERVIAGLANARAKGKVLGRRANKPISVGEIIEAHKDGLSDREIALKMCLPVSSVYSAIKRYKVTQVV
ncbi:DNA invertase [Candidatus Magnetobacterium bavaricum]|uniref:DNA invertase n=1 Tax=Candidatus Magnetobacterium bavaricum TaxID=29290 RepID=A0A0F3GLU3_9BACT|nr:DNA invertase [Candidatus Magnetobacterium bavaricum]